MTDAASGGARHAALAAGKWSSYSLVEQMGNIGSEVERALRAVETGNPDRRDRALDRALELFDLTAADGRWHGGRRREVLRAREYVCRVVFGGGALPGDADFLRRYFLQFAVAARVAARVGRA